MLVVAMWIIWLIVIAVALSLMGYAYYVGVAVLAGLVIIAVMFLFVNVINPVCSAFWTVFKERNNHPT